MHENSNTAMLMHGGLDKIRLTDTRLHLIEGNVQSLSQQSRSLTPYALDVAEI
jgi:hypothetical protein